MKKALAAVAVAATLCTGMAVAMPASVSAPVGATTYEDGSWRAADGSTGCLPGGLCND